MEYKNVFEYKDFIYEYELDIEPEENCKILHSCFYLENGEENRVVMHYTPYEKMTEENFQLYVEVFLAFKKRGELLGRHDGSNLREESLHELAKQEQVGPYSS